MIRALTLVCLACAVLAFAACGGDSYDDAAPSDGGASSTTVTESPQADGGPTFGDVKLATEINPDTKEPITEVTSFPSDAKTMHATVNVKNLPAGGEFRFRWTKGTAEAATVVVDVPEAAADTWVAASVSPPGAIPVGDDWLLAVSYNGTPIGSVVFSVRDAGG